MKQLILLALCFFLTACGGSGNDNFHSPIKGEEASSIKSEEASSTKSEDTNTTKVTIVFNHLNWSESLEIVNSKTLDIGASFAYSFSVIQGYELKLSTETTCNGELKDNTYIIEEATQDCTVKVVASEKAISISLAPDDRSSIELVRSPHYTGDREIYYYGDKAELTIVASDGFIIEKVSGCGVQKQNNDSYITLALKSDCEITTSTVSKADANRVFGVEFADTNFAICVREHVNAQKVERFEDLTSLSCNQKDIEVVSELQLMTGLTSLQLITNQFSTINLDANLALTQVDLRGNIFDDATLDYLATISWIADFQYRVAAATGKLNDTGITWCANKHDSFRYCPTSSFEGQDAERGRDVQAMTGKLQKVGGGSDGFDFTKLDADGKDLPGSASKWSCVRDNHTGLIWEVKTKEGRRSTYHKYNWYNPDNKTNGSHPGFQDDDGAICYRYDPNDETTYCNTHSYVEQVNSQSLCGASDWRLPNRQELRSIVDFGTDEYSRTVDKDFFPLTQERYWSSSPYASNYREAWVVYFTRGGVWPTIKDADAYIRLVRSEK